MQRTIKTTKAIANMNTTARAARRLCTDIIRQTTTTPYYRKVGGAALYAASDYSDEQAARLRQAGEHLRAAAELLRDVAVAGGLTEARLLQSFQDDELTEQNAVLIPQR